MNPGHGKKKTSVFIFLIWGVEQTWRSAIDRRQPASKLGYHAVEKVARKHFRMRDKV